MTALWTLARNTWREQLRSRFFLVVVVFGGVLLYASVLLGMMAVDQELRVLVDFGLGFIELLGLTASVLVAATGILREMETKTIYMVLSRPVSKWSYLLGRFAGLLLAVASAIAAMAAIHLPLLLVKGWAPEWGYAAALAGGFLKIAVVSALATLAAIFSTSVTSALSVTLILWVLGHFLAEMKYLAVVSGGDLSPFLLAPVYMIPNLQLLNLRDRLEVPGTAFWGAGLGIPVVYAALYAAVCLGLAQFLFRRKEF